MNRQQRRRIAKKTGLPFKDITKIANKVDQAPNLKDGDKVMINVEKVSIKSDFDSLNPDYVNFVKSSEGTVYTVCRDEKYKNRPIVSLAEDERNPKWLFYEGDLIKVEEEKND